MMRKYYDYQTVKERAENIAKGQINTEECESKENEYITCWKESKEIEDQKDMECESKDNDILLVGKKQKTQKCPANLFHNYGQDEDENDVYFVNVRDGETTIMDKDYVESGCDKIIAKLDKQLSYTYHPMHALCVMLDIRFRRISLSYDLINDAMGFAKKIFQPQVTSLTCTLAI